MRRRCCAARPRGLHEAPGRRAAACPSDRPADVLPLGPARGSVVNGGATRDDRGAHVRDRVRAAASAACSPSAGCAAGRSHRAGRGGPPPTTSSADPWPHTTRLLPWMFAVFLALIWLTPFNNIEMNVSLPIELRLDRLVLPVLVLLWCLAIGVGGRIAPRLRMTWVHVAIGGLLATAFLSVVRRRALPQPVARARPLAQEAPADALVRDAVPDRVERDPAQRGRATS